MRVEMLSKQREFDLATAWRERGDEHAKDEIVMSHTPLVLKIVGRYSGFAVSSEDLFAEGCLGLMTAIDKFEPERGFRFSTYARWWVRAAIEDYIVRNWSVVRSKVTSSGKRMFFKTYRVRDVGLDEPMTEGGATLGEILPAPDIDLDGYLDTETRIGWLREALCDLDERERLIIRRRHLAEDHAMLEELGVELGVSKERVRQLETRAIEKLRSVLTRREKSAVVTRRLEEA